MAVALLVSGVLSFILLILDTELDIEGKIFTALKIICIFITTFLCVVNISLEGASDLYAPCNDYSLVVKQIKYSKENTCLYKCYTLDENDVWVGKYFRFYDELGKFNVGDTLKIIKNETK